MIRTLHPIAGGVGIATIATFWLSTVAVEALGSPGAVLNVKTAILWGLLLLVPALVITGATGLRMGGRSTNQLIARKRAAGCPSLRSTVCWCSYPAPFFYKGRAAAGDFGSALTFVQGIELLAGAVNLTLMGLNMRDGLALTRRTATTKPGVWGLATRSTATQPGCGQHAGGSGSSLA